MILWYHQKELRNKTLALFLVDRRIMKISCNHCGRIHEKKFDCGKKPVYIRKRYEKDVFRSSYTWQKKAKEIKERDNYLCQLCLRGYRGTRSRINNTRLSVHHAVPLKQDYELRLENENLITVCDIHHELLEKGVISLKEAKSVIREQEKRSPRG